MLSTLLANASEHVLKQSQCAATAITSLRAKAIRALERCDSSERRICMRFEPSCSYVAMLIELVVMLCRADQLQGVPVRSTRLGAG